MLVLLVCCLIVNHALRVNSVVFEDELPISGTANIKGLKQYIDSKIKEDILQTQGIFLYLISYPYFSLIV